MPSSRSAARSGFSGSATFSDVPVLRLFLRSAAATFVAVLVIPVTVLLTLIGLRLLGMSFNLMTLGGIAAVIGIVIDDAIVVVEAIHAKVLAGNGSKAAIKLAMRGNHPINQRVEMPLKIAPILTSFQLIFRDP